MKRKLLLSLAVLFVAAIGTRIWVKWEERRSTTVILADGSRLVFLGATVGANCSFDYGSPWQRLAARLPAKWQRMLGVGAAQNPVVNAGYSGDSSVVFWFVRRGSPTRTNVTKVIYNRSSRSPTYAIGAGVIWDMTSSADLVNGLRINLKDEQGDGVPGLQYLSEATLPSGDTAVFWRTDVVPSTGRMVFLRFYEWTKPTGLKYTWELQVPNPLQPDSR